MNACSACAGVPAEPTGVVAEIVALGIDQHGVVPAHEHAVREVGRRELADLRGRDLLLLREREDRLAVGVDVHWPSPVPWNAGFVGTVVPPV